MCSFFPPVPRDTPAGTPRPPRPKTSVKKKELLHTIYSMWYSSSNCLLIRASKCMYSAVQRTCQQTCVFEKKSLERSLPHSQNSQCFFLCKKNSAPVLQDKGLLTFKPPFLFQECLANSDFPPPPPPPFPPPIFPYSV